ncbi:MAG: glutamate-5-semialdehyde dehydrogenase [Spirochaetales bacterium]|nr:glutamate-5-semialdehyde dehydrogenase [Spirochaetales bacterium]
MSIQDAAREAKEAARKLAALDGKTKNRALEGIARRLTERKENIFAANQKDLERSRKEELAPPLIKRLTFNQGKLDEVTTGITSLIALDDPVGKKLRATELDEGLNLYQVACPIGVIGMIFESRPDALVQIASLCLKSGNGVLLKGGSEARETNRILADIIAEASVDAGCPAGWIQLLESREEVQEMLALDKLIDLIIPRGSNSFVQYIMKNSNIPVMGHADGICHVYIDAQADPDKAVPIVVDSKTQYVAVCNALETLLINRSIAPTLLPRLKEALEARNVELRGCDETVGIIDVEKADEKDWETEYLDYILSIKIVGSPQEAIDHIHRYGSGHTDAIVTEDVTAAEDFMNRVDTADVLWNCSTRFADGFRYGLGAEVGISTAKIHARGPVGMEGLMIYKWRLYGNGHIVDDYSTGKKHFIHRNINIQDTAK